MANKEEREARVASIITGLWPHRMSRKAAEIIDDYYLGILREETAAVRQSLAESNGLADKPGIPTCKRCGEAEGRRDVVTLQSGGWMHYEPCWLSALYEPAQRDLTEDDHLIMEGKD